MDLLKKKEDLQEKDLKKKDLKKIEELVQKLDLEQKVVQPSTKKKHQQQQQQMPRKNKNFVYVIPVNKEDKLEMKSYGRNYDLQKMMY